MATSQLHRMRLTTAIRRRESHQHRQINGFVGTEYGIERVGQSRAPSTDSGFQEFIRYAFVDGVQRTLLR